MGAFMSYPEYHRISMEAKDVDPAVICLDYIANRFELNQSQRYWIAFLYGTNYCAPTTFLMYNEFPDFENVDVKRLESWWQRNKKWLIFQTDRLRIKSNNQFVPSFESYRRLTKMNQEWYFAQATDWLDCYKRITAIKNFGRFSAFNYLDVLNKITGVNHKPLYLDMAEAESCRNGLCHAIGRSDLVGAKMTSSMNNYLNAKFIEVLRANHGNIFQVETTLCAYNKYMKGQRYIGYYIERMRKEIMSMQSNFSSGVAWEVLWQFREETFERRYLNEFK